MTLGHGYCVVDLRPGIPKEPWATMRPMSGRAAVDAALAGAPKATLDLMTGN